MQQRSRWLRTRERSPWHCVSRKTINTVENGVFTPSATLALKLARALGVKVEQIFALRD